MYLCIKYLQHNINLLCYTWHLEKYAAYIYFIHVIVEFGTLNYITYNSWNSAKPLVCEFFSDMES